MKVKQLIEQLQRFDPEKDVILGVSNESEYFHDVDEVEEAVWEYDIHAFALSKEVVEREKSRIGGEWVDKGDGYVTQERNVVCITDLGSDG